MVKESSLQTENFVKWVESDTKLEVKSKPNPIDCRNNLFEKYECFHWKAQINNKNFLAYHRDNCHIKFENIMHSFAKLSEDLKLPCNKCKKKVRIQRRLRSEQHNILYLKKLWTEKVNQNNDFIWWLSATVKNKTAFSSALSNKNSCLKLFSTPRIF